MLSLFTLKAELDPFFPTLFYFVKPITRTHFGSLVRVTEYAGFGPPVWFDNFRAGE